MNYYNEFSAAAAAWLRQLIEENLIPAGIVDTRSIADVTPADLLGFAQCHFFAGIGGWPLALRLAGVSPATELWTGSCPCQPFSSAGKGRGADDERHLWPVFARLIAQCRPPIVIGEQVDSAIGHGWLDGVCADLENESYAVGAAVLPACGSGAPQRRYRLFWAGVLADTDSQRCNGIDASGSMVNGIEPRLEGHDRNGNDSDQSGLVDANTTGSTAEAMRVAIHCADGNYRRVPTQSLFQRVADGFSPDLDRMRNPRNGYPLAEKGQVPHRRQLLHGYGNAIHPAITAEFIRALLQ